MSTPTRRAVLAGAALAPFLIACESGQGATAKPSSTLPPSGHGSTTLRSLYTPSSPQYATAKKLFNPSFDGRKPAAVAAVRSEDEVRHAVNDAHAHNLKVAARCGGHSYIGASAPNGALVVDVRGLATVSYDPKTQHATIGAGARLYDVHAALAKHGRAIPTGTCPTVGVSGLATGGGIGVSSRQHGLTCDAVVSARIVLADGSVITADAKTNSDVFWALRGGGGGLVGIVTQWTFATHPAVPHGSFSLSFSAQHPERVLIGWAQWVQNAPRTQWANLHLTRTSSGLTLSVVGITAAGDEHEAASALMSAVGSQAVKARYGRRSHMDTVAYLGGGTTSPRTSFTAGSDVIRTMNDATASAIVRAVHQAPSGCTAILDPLTGAVQDKPSAPSAFPWRGHLASVQWYTGSTSASARSWIGAAHRCVASASAGRYLNYVEPGTSLKDYLGPNVAQANKIRESRDPKNLFVTSVAG